MKTVLPSNYLRYFLCVSLFSFALIFNAKAQTQLGIYQFTGLGLCPNTSNTVTSQPANATFSAFTGVGVTCATSLLGNDYSAKGWNTSNTFDPTEYYQFTITPSSGYGLTLTSLTFTEYVDKNQNNNTWFLRSSIDNYATDIATGSISTSAQTPTVNLPAANFTATGAVTFRIYVTNQKDAPAIFSVDEVTLNGTTVVVPNDPPNPTSDSPQCATPGITLFATGTPPAGETWYWQTSPSGTSTAASGSVYTVTTSGTYYIRSQDNTTTYWSTGAGSVSVTVTPNVGTPSFSLGASSTRCQGAGIVSYTATASNNSGLTYSLDANSLAAGNTINSSTGDVTYTSAWSGTSTITVTATGCGSSTTASHTVTISPVVSSLAFAMGGTSTRCQGAGTVTYSATASNTTGITYSLNAAAITGGVTINSSTGLVTYPAGWGGTTTITATAAGCSAQTVTHTVTITPTVGTPVFSLGSTSTRCQGAGTVNYSATATNSTGITYSLNVPAITGGCSINASTGDVTFPAGWTGSTIITATSTGCNGPKTATHTVTITASVGTPVFSLGSTTTRCQASGNTTYTATASGSTTVTYTLDANSIAAGNSINAYTGVVTYSASWNGTSTITANAVGCSSTSTASHTVTITPAVNSLAFAMGGTSTRCQGTGSVTYSATASNTTGITYSLNAAAITGGCSINSSTGVVTYSASWTGTTIITATAAGCTAQTLTHTVTITPTVGTPVFALGSTSTRCQAAGTVTYTATSTNSTGITYSLDATSLIGGNTIDPNTGVVTYNANWYGTSVILATSAGCNGPKTTTHTVTTNAPVTVPVFTLGSTYTRCQGTSTQVVTFAATATNTLGALTYTLDATTDAYSGNSINSSTGAVTFASGWTGTSTVVVNAPGCYGPQAATITITTTPYVTTPVFSMGSTSTRCQGNATVVYAATSTNTTGITYSIDATSLAAGNTINASTGALTFTSTWSGTTVVTASAAGCSGPKTTTHTITTTATVGTPSFLMGPSSYRAQGAGTVTYTANATTTTGITYTLDATSLAGGNTINASTGAVHFSAGWSGVSVVTASAAGCNGPAVSTHTIYTNASWVSLPLYLSDPSQALDRIDPVSTNDMTTSSTTALSIGNNTTFTQNPALCSDLTIKAGTINLSAYVTVSSGTLPANPSVTATLKYGSNNIITLINPSYNSGTGIMTWTGILGSDVVVPAGQALALNFSSNQAGASFTIDYDSKLKPSQIHLPVSSYITVINVDVYDAAYPGGHIRNTILPGTNYLRATVTSPFGASDINSLSLTMSPPGVTVTATQVGTTACSNIYEYQWTTPGSTGLYVVSATAHEGTENTITFTKTQQVNICTTCPPVAVDDSASGAGGAPVVIDVLANDYDPNNNINSTSLVVVSPPQNGDAVLSNGKIVYIPNGTFAGTDAFTYQICDLSSPTPLCATANVKVTIDPTIVDPCTDATESHVFYISYPETDAKTALLASQNTGLAINNLRTVISLKMPYPNMKIVWDQWEDGYEVNPLSPTQSTTQVWGDGNPYNGIAPGYPDDIIPAGGSIVLDNTIPLPRNASNIFYDGRDKIFSTGQISITQVTGEPSRISVQCMKTDVASTKDFGTSFTIPVGEDFPSQDFQYTALFIRAGTNSTTINIDKDNDGVFETTTTLNEGQSLLVNGGVLTGAKVTSSAPVGVDLHVGGVDNYSSREVPLYPASWYSNVYYTPVPTTGASTPVKDTNVVYLYNSLNRQITINWSSGVPSSGSITLPARTVKRFAMPLSQTAAYKFVNPTGESFTAIEVCDSYSPGNGTNSGSTYDWAFNLISEERLTTFATTAWAPGSTDGTRNDNPVWVTPSANTTIYVKYDGNLLTGGSVSPIGLHYDASYPLNALNHKRLRNPSQNDQSGLAVFTADGTKLAVVYGEDPSTALTGSPSWDVGSTIRPFCAMKLIFANDDYAYTITDNPVTIPILKNDNGFNAVIDPSSVNLTGLLQPKNGTVTVNSNGTLLYTPNPGFQGLDTLEYNVCSTPSPVVCDKATVYIKVTSCPTPNNQNLIQGQVFLDRNKDGINNDGKIGFPNAKVYLYVDGNCNGTINSGELVDSVMVDSSGTYQFITYPEKTVIDNFEGTNGSSSCNSGSDGSASWLSNWVDAGDPSVGYCVTPAQSITNTKVEIVQDGSFSHAIRLKGSSVSATRTVNLSGSSYAFLTFSYRRGSNTFTNGKSVIVQASTNGTSFSTIYTIDGDGTKDNSYVTVYNQDISSYAAPVTYIRFLTTSNVADADSVFIDSVSIKYLKYPQCYITKLDPTSIPTVDYITTPGQRNVSVSASGLCFAPYDFGIARISINISGTVHNDLNGLTDVLVNGTGLGVHSGTQLYAYLVDSSGNVAFKTTVNSNGTYSFPNADVQTMYQVVVSTSSVALYTPAPAWANLVSGWVGTGASFGINNNAGTGVRAGCCTMTVVTGLTDITNVDFGIEQMPESAVNLQPSANNPSGYNSVVVPAAAFGISNVSVDVNPNTIDYAGGVVTNIRITAFPSNVNTITINGVTYTSTGSICPPATTCTPWPVNGVTVPAAGGMPTQIIKIDPIDGAVTVVIPFAAIDNAGVEDPTPGSVTIPFQNSMVTLPIDLLSFTGKALQNSNLLTWVTSQEVNSDYFEVETKTDQTDFTKIGTVQAKGNSSVSTTYNFEHRNPPIGMNYYRLRIVDKANAFKYSQVIALKTDANGNGSVYPNPFQDRVDITFTSGRAGKVSIKIYDVNGKLVRSEEQVAVNGMNVMTVKNLGGLTSGVYTVEVADTETIVRAKLFKE